MTLAKPVARIFRLQYAAYLPRTISVNTLDEYLIPVAKTLVLLGHVPDAEVVVECGKRWQNVIYAPFCFPSMPGHSIWPANVFVLRQTLSPFHFLSKDNVGFLEVSSNQANPAKTTAAHKEIYDRWTYRGASVVLLSDERLRPPFLARYANRPPLTVFASSPASCNLADYATLSVSNPATRYDGQRIRNYDRQAFAEFLVKDEQECTVDYDLARAATTYRIVPLK